MAKPMRAIIFAEIELLQDIRIPHNNHQDLQNQEMIPESLTPRGAQYQLLHHLRAAYSRSQAAASVLQRTLFRTS